MAPESNAFSAHDSAIVSKPETTFCSADYSDEYLLKALGDSQPKSSSPDKHIFGVSKRKLKSLQFRLQRRALKIAQVGCPFNKRDTLKNANRSSAALARKRDDNGKFLNVPIHPKTKPKECQIFV